MGGYVGTSVPGFAMTQVSYHDGTFYQLIISRHLQGMFIPLLIWGSPIHLYTVGSLSRQSKLVVYLHGLTHLQLMFDYVQNTSTVWQCSVQDLYQNRLIQTSNVQLESLIFRPNSAKLADALTVMKTIHLILGEYLVRTAKAEQSMCPSQPDSPTIFSPLQTMLHSGGTATEVPPMVASGPSSHLHYNSSTGAIASSEKQLIKGKLRALTPEQEELEELADRKRPQSSN